MRELTVVIPARNEMFLQNTVDDVLANTDPELTEVIVVLDGYWPEVGLPVNERLSVIHKVQSIGQRAATNLGIRLANTKYVMKLDAHCAVAHDLDKTLLTADLEEGVMQVPAQYNLHAFNWVCPKGHSRYQGKSGPCEECGEPTTREIVWQRRRRGPKTTAWRFDTDLHFQYWPEWQRHPEFQKQMPYTETMSLLGACWFMSRDQFFKIGCLDEEHGSWGQMGTELACKQWLSGSRVVCNQNTWYAHMFRTQGGDFGFPYDISKRQTDAARAHSRKLWFENTWPGAKKQLRWLVERWPEPHPVWRNYEWQDGNEGGLARRSDPVPHSRTHRPTIGILYYTDGRLANEIAVPVRKQLMKAGLLIVSSSLKPIGFGDTQIVFTNKERGILTMFEQILAGLQLLDTDVVFFAEHDILYPPEHFEFQPQDVDTVYYDENWWKVDATTGRAITYTTKQVSGLCAFRITLLEHYAKRVAMVKEKGFTRRMGFEPGSHGRRERVDDLKSASWRSTRPHVDIRHGTNLTPSRWHPDQFRNQQFCQGWQEAIEVPGWGRTLGRFGEFLKEVI